MKNIIRIKYIKIVILLFSLIAIESCGSFGEGILMGLANCGSGGYGYNTGTPMYTGSGNMDYLLDPNYAMAQVLAQEENEYQNFCQYNKKYDGSNYTKEEWRNLGAGAYNNCSSQSSSSSTSYSSSSSNRKCMKSSASDYAHCNGTGVCSRCNGKGSYLDNSFGISKWVQCTYCGGTGKCGSCGGKGYK